MVNQEQVSLLILDQFPFDSQYPRVFDPYKNLLVVKFLPVKNAHFTIAGEDP